MGMENLLDKFGLRGEVLPKKRVSEKAVAHLINPTYLKQSSALIKDALQNGEDVLQLANGDIVTTTTKTVITKYVWNASKSKLVKSKTREESLHPKRESRPATTREKEDA